MKLTAEQLQFLADKGLSLGEVIQFANLTPERTKAAERQARYRERMKAEAEGGDVTRDVTRDRNASDASPALSPAPNEINSNPHPHTHPNTKPRARKGSRLSDDWSPSALKGEVSTDVATWPPGAIERELARFRDWAASATGPNATKSDWDAAWRNWLRKAHDEGRWKQNGRSAPQHFSGNSTLRELAERSLADG